MKTVFQLQDIIIIKPLFYNLTLWNLTELLLIIIKIDISNNKLTFMEKL